MWWSSSIMVECALSRKEVKRVRQLVGPLGKAAIEIAHLIADVDDDRVAQILKLFALRGLEFDRRFRREVVRLQEEPGPFISRRAQIGFRRGAQAFGPSGQEEHRDPALSSETNEGQDRSDRLRAGHHDPCEQPAWASRKIARAAEDEAIVVGANAGQVRERRLIDVDDDRQLASALRPRFEERARLLGHGGDIGVITAGVDVLADLALYLDETGRTGDRGRCRRRGAYTPRGAQDEREQTQTDESPAHA